MSGLNHFTNSAPVAPRFGDFSMCMVCGKPSVLTRAPLLANHSERVEQGNRIKKRGHPERSAARAKAGRHGVEGSREFSQDHQTGASAAQVFHGILRLRDARHLRPPGIAPPQNDPVFLMRLPCRVETRSASSTPRAAAGTSSSSPTANCARWRSKSSASFTARSSRS